jgi:hypothetical protein
VRRTQAHALAEAIALADINQPGPSAVNRDLAVRRWFRALFDWTGDCAHHKGTPDHPTQLSDFELRRPFGLRQKQAR